MFDVGGGELLLIVLAILLLFGPQKLPEVAQTIGKGMRKVKQAQAQFQSQLNEIQNEITKDEAPSDKSKTSNDKPTEPTENVSLHKIGAYDQLDLDQNFVTNYIRNEEEKAVRDSEVTDENEIPKTENEN
jgi:TatA/E family protein of Tat protein translocase